MMLLCANILNGGLFRVFLAVGLVVAMTPALTPAQLFDICESATLSEAAVKGDRLGWQRMSEAEFEEWRARFISYHGGSVQALGWRRGEKAEEDSLTFWIAQGPNTHKACAYSTANPVKLLEALSAYFGPPLSLDQYDFGTTASWKRDTTDVSFSHVGSRALVNISSRY